MHFDIRVYWMDIFNPTRARTSYGMVFHLQTNTKGCHEELQQTTQELTFDRVAAAVVEGTCGAAFILLGADPIIFYEYLLKAEAR